MLKNIFVLAAFATFAAQAQTVPAIDPNQPLLAVVDPGMGEQTITVTKKEREALNISKKWMDNPDRPRPDADGSVKYLFGATLPTLICTPAHMCAVRFQPGESVEAISFGDSTRWKYSLSQFGNGNARTEVVAVKPLESGLVTNMVVTTDRRVYTILLKAARKEWMPFISFHYPDDDEKALALQLAQRQKAEYSSTLSNGMNVANLDFGFRIGGDNVPWKPIRAYSDGAKTYIEFASLGNEAPALVELGDEGGIFSDPETKVVNYRLVGKRYVVDGVPKLIGLISGVGNNQKKVTIERTGGNK
jgi:type IV secretion system protein VirB9